MATAILVLAIIVGYLFVGILTGVVAYRYMAEVRKDPEFMVTWSVFLWPAMWMVGLSIGLSKITIKVVKAVADVQGK